MCAIFSLLCTIVILSAEAKGIDAQLMASTMFIELVVYVFQGNPYDGGKLNTRAADLLSFKQLPLYTSSTDYV